MSRKTITVGQVVDFANYVLAHSTCSPEQRVGVICMVEAVLHHTDNYNGFCYLNVSEVPKGELPGINLYPNGGFIYDNYEARFENTDPTRVMYHYSGE